MRQIITISPAENGWLIHLTEDAGPAHIESQKKTYVARNVMELSEVVEEIAIDQTPQDSSNGVTMEEIYREAEKLGVLR